VQKKGKIHKLSCQYKGRQCLDVIRPIITPNGLCYAVSLNETVQRPGEANFLELLHNRGVIHVKNFSKFFSLEMTPLGVKTCGESEFDIFEAKNASLIQGRCIVY
jgi:hypothetical protein